MHYRSIPASGLQARTVAVGCSRDPLYCKDDDRRETYPHQKFDFSRLHVSAETVAAEAGHVWGLVQSGSQRQSSEAIRQTIRGWTLHERSDKTLDDLALRPHQRLGGEEGQAPFGARSETTGLRLGAME
jgi:hypothetical protein